MTYINFRKRCLVSCGTHDVVVYGASASEYDPFTATDLVGGYTDGRGRRAGGGEEKIRAFFNPGLGKEKF